MTDNAAAEVTLTGEGITSAGASVNRTVKILIDGEVGIEHDFDRQVKVVPIPKQAPYRTLYIDLQRLVWTVTLNGWLTDSSSGGSAITKKQNFEDLVRKAGQVTASWGVGSDAVSYETIILKSKIKEQTKVVEDDDTTSNPTKGYIINVQLGVGKFTG